MFAWIPAEERLRSSAIGVDELEDVAKGVQMLRSEAGEHAAIFSRSASVSAAVRRASLLVVFHVTQA